MITDYILQILIALISGLFTPVYVLLRPVFDSIAPFLDTTFATLKTMLSWASVFIHPNILRAFLLYIPAIWGFIALAYITKWVITLIRG
ncbi:MAG: hypothetical protein QXT77_09025 [Candidatus Methanomethylicaceae archaeon]